MKNKLSKIMDKLNMSVSISTLGMLGALTWGLWYAAACYSDGLIKWALLFLPPVLVVSFFVIQLRHGDDD